MMRAQQARDGMNTRLFIRTVREDLMNKWMSSIRMYGMYDLIKTYEDNR